MWIYITQDLNAQIAELQRQVDRSEGVVREERSNHEITLEEIRSLQRQIEALRTETTNQKSEDEAKFNAQLAKHQAEKANLEKVSCHIL